MSRLQTRLMLAIMSIFLFLGATQAYAEQIPIKKYFPGHYLYTNRTTAHGMPPLGSQEDLTMRQLISANPNWQGYTVKYTWRGLEPRFGVYDFSAIERDLRTAVNDGKKLAIFFRERVFSASDPFPGPSYMDPTSSDFNRDYEGAYFRDSKGWHPNLTHPAIGVRMRAIVTALGNEFDSHPALSSITFQETAVVDMKDQPGFTGLKYMNYLKDLHAAAEAAFPTTIVVQLVNWRGGMSEAETDEMMLHFVESRGAFGEPDIMRKEPSATNITSPFDTQFKDYFINNNNKAPIWNHAQAVTFNASNARDQIDFAVDRLGAHFITWLPRRFLYEAFSIYDVINEVDADQGRTNTVAPESLINPTPKPGIPAPTGITISLE